MAGPGLARARALAELRATRCGACTGRTTRRRSRPTRRRASASPSTSCSPTSWRSALVRRARAPAGGPRARRRRPAAARGAGRPALSPDRRRSAQALAEIDADMARPARMLRLLQGDVGSGKTLVALLAMLAAVEAGGQAALMAPTEVLARQHQATLARLLAPAGLDARRCSPAASAAPARARAAGRPGERPGPDRGRDPRPVPGRGRVRRPGARGDRRAAPLRRPPAPRPRRQGRGAGSAGDDRDADPAHAGAGALRRHGGLGAAREAARPPADRHPRHAARPARARSWRAVERGARARRAALLGLPADRRRRGRRAIRRPPSSAIARSRRGSAPLVGLVHGRMPAAEQGPRDGALRRAARSACWSPPR